MIAGRVLDAERAEPRAGAAISIVGTTQGALADADGRFVISAVAAGERTIRAHLLGYAALDRVVVVRAGDTTRVELRLQAEAQVLNAVRTEARPIDRELFDSRPAVGTVQITARAAEGVPKLGEPDVLRIVQLLPGVEARNDFSTGFNVRGGEADQNLILLDGYPIYNPFHVGGLFSTFIDPTVGDITLMTGGFPARYGSRLSSVLDVHSADEARAGLHGTVGALAAVVDGRVGRLVRPREGVVDGRGAAHVRRRVREPDQQQPTAVSFSRRAGALLVCVLADDEARLSRRTTGATC